MTSPEEVRDALVRAQVVQQELGERILRTSAQPCCAAPLSVENPDCVWHRYRSFGLAMGEALERSRVIETHAQAHALRFFRDGALKEAARKVLTDNATASEVISDLITDVNHLLAQLEGMH